VSSMATTSGGACSGMGPADTCTSRAGATEPGADEEGAARGAGGTGTPGGVEARSMAAETGTSRVGAFEPGGIPGRAPGNRLEPGPGSADTAGGAAGAAARAMPAARPAPEPGSADITGGAAGARGAAGAAEALGATGAVSPDTSTVGEPPG